MKKFLLPILFISTLTNAQIISTIAGTGTAGYTGDGGQANLAKLNSPEHVALDASGNIYIADATNHCIRKINIAGIITTIAGTGVQGYAGDGGAATLANFDYPSAIAVDVSGNIYIADLGNSAIRMINTSGVINTIAGNGTQGFSGDGGLAVSATLDWASGVAVDATGNVYIADLNNNRIRMINTSGIINTIAGNGTTGSGGDGGLATAAQFNQPNQVIVDAAGKIYVSDSYNHKIRMINTSGIISTVAGTGAAGYSGDGGLATAAQLNAPNGMALDAAGNLFIPDYYNNVVRKVDLSGIITTVAGTGPAGYAGDGGPALNALMDNVSSVTVDPAGNLYITDLNSNALRFVCNAPDTVSGLITEPNTNPVTSGKVYVYRHKLTHAGLLDTAGFTPINTNGTYKFNTLPDGDYFIQAVPSVTYTNGVSTYYSSRSNHYMWDSATIISHRGCAFNIFTGYNIVIEETPVQTGTCTVSGSISSLPGYGTRQIFPNTVMGAPLKGVEVKLGKNPGAGVAARTTTGTTGTYTFTGMDTGSYYVFVDIPNFGMDTILIVNLTNSSSSSINNDYCVDSLKIGVCAQTTALDPSTNSSYQISAFPNPASSEITFSIPSDIKEIGIVIYDLNGRTVFNDSLPVKNNTANTPLNLDNGMYLVSVKSNNSTRFIKLLVTH